MNFQKFKLTLSYHGHPYQGWQSQADGNSVQDHLQMALSKIVKSPIKIHGSGRTDTGVHALAQVAHFEIPIEQAFNALNWVPALNTQLPKSIRAIDCQTVPADFHARFDALSKTYSYHLCLSPILSPFKSDLVWHLPSQFDSSLLKQATSLFLGEHDFSAFAANRGNNTPPPRSTVRTLTQAEVLSLDDGWKIEFSGKGFLYKMVRLMVGGIVQVSRGKYLLNDLENLLHHPSSNPEKKSPLCAPPQGLYLKKVDYS